MTPESRGESYRYLDCLLSFLFVKLAMTPWPSQVLNHTATSQPSHSLVTVCPGGVVNSLSSCLHQQVLGLQAGLFDVVLEI